MIITHAFVKDDDSVESIKQFYYRELDITLAFSHESEYEYFKDFLNKIIRNPKEVKVVIDE